MKSFNIVTLLMATLLQGVVCSFSSSLSSNEDSNVPSASETNQDHSSALKKPSWFSSSLSSSNVSKTTRTLKGKGKRGVCPDVLKKPKEGMLYMKLDLQGEGAVNAAYGQLVPYDGVTAPAPDDVVMLFQGIFIGSPSGYLSGHFGTGALDKDGNEYSIFAPISGMIALEGGGVSEFPIVNPHTMPFGKSLCGVDKLEFIRFNNTDIRGETIVTVH